MDEKASEEIQNERMKPMKHKTKQNRFMLCLCGILMAFGVFCWVYFGGIQRPTSYTDLVTTSGTITAVEPLYHEIIPFFQTQPYGHSITLDNGTTYRDIPFAEWQTSVAYLQIGEKVTLQYAPEKQIYTMKSNSAVYFTYDSMKADFAANRKGGIWLGVAFAAAGILLAFLYFLPEWHRQKRQQERHNKRYADYLERKAAQKHSKRKS